MKKCSFVTDFNGVLCVDVLQEICFTLLNFVQACDWTYCALGTSLLADIFMAQARIWAMRMPAINIMVVDVKSSFFTLHMHDRMKDRACIALFKFSGFSYRCLSCAETLLMIYFSLHKGLVITREREIM